MNDFLDSIKLDQFRIVTDQRQRIAKRIKELQPAASQRAIAKTLGVDEVTVRRDLGTKKDTAANAAPSAIDAEENMGSSGRDSANAAPSSAPAVPSAAAAAKFVMDAASVCRKFETSRRREVLSFSHHREVAALPPDQADALLDQAERESASHLCTPCSCVAPRPALSVAVRG